MVADSLRIGAKLHTSPERGIVLAKTARKGLERPVLRSSARLSCNDELGNFGRCFLNCHAFPL
jgi:hypothetical protein